MACTVTLPPNALTAQGMSTPWRVSGSGCDQTVPNMASFAECVIVNANGIVGIYAPLLVNANATAKDFIPPVVPTFDPAATVGCWFGTNGGSTTLADNNNGADLAAAKCINGKPGVTGDIFGQFAACNAPAFFQVANKAVTPPALGMGKNGKPCYTTRSYEIVDMDPSDNMVSSFLHGKNGVIGQTNAANRAALTDKATTTPPDEFNNGSDNLLLDALYRPALGCTVYKAPNLAAPGDNAMVGALALNELQATLQANQALVPVTDPMTVLTDGATVDVVKVNAYRSCVNQPALAAGVDTNAEKVNFCSNYYNVAATGFITDMKFLIGQPTPDPTNGKDLFTFLGQRFQVSWQGLGCPGTVQLGNFANGTAVNEPITAIRDANGVTQQVQFNSQTLQTLLMQNGGPNAEAILPASVYGVGNVTVATSLPAPAPQTQPTATANAGTPTQGGVTTVTITVAPSLSVVVISV
ncbi:hypothetical protein BC830DRAFT_1076940 [Chytriomyces sp. MP71]|nr:hypothetical protein BC830DRAFT_1076940 [Chytriomyces sp. MP71]